MPVPARVVKLGQSLVRAQVIDALQLESVLANAEMWGARLGRVITEMRLNREPAIVQAISQATNVPVVDLSQVAPEPGALQRLDGATCQERGILPLQYAETGRTLTLGMCDPTDLETIDIVAQRTRCRVRPVVVGEQLLAKAIQRYYQGQNVAIVLEEEELISEIDEVKLVDVNGRTLMIENAVLSLREAAAKAGTKLPPPANAAPPPPKPAAPAPPPKPPAPAQTAPPPPRPAPAPAPAPAATNTIEQQLAQIRQMVEMNQKLTRAMLELLIEKRVIAADEIRAKMNR